MTLALGVDTGGTYTDAVLVRDEKEVIASAKSLTTRHDLADGIGRAVAAVLSEGGVEPGDITLASLSTTLATNALIEGQGERIGLILAGFSERDMQRHGLAEALAGDPHVMVRGGHDHAGSEAAPLDEAALEAWLAGDGASVSGYAVATQFATRNTAHERRILEILQARTGKPVSCSHHLSSKLNGPKRAITAVLNARLIGMINRLITRAQRRLQELGVGAPLMVVRGDGALISADFALQRPIETILSGPAASIVGARWMTGAQNALVSDIGGTTTDIAVLHEGRPAIDPAGARVGPFRTMVVAVAMRTTGLGGDSQVHMRRDGLEGAVSLGPRRVLPVALIAQQAPDVVLPVLEKQLLAETPPEHFAQFVLAVQGMQRAGLAPKEAALLERIGTDVHPLGRVLNSRMEHNILRRLIDRGLVQVSGVTPSDASHVLGRTDQWHKAAAEAALTLFARQITGAGARLAQTSTEMAEMIIDQLTHQTALALLETAFEEEGDFDAPPMELARHVLMQRGLSGHRGLLRLDSGLNVPVVGLGASAATYYPAVGARLGCTMELPPHAGVANAIGAVVGRITIRRSGSITSPAEGMFRVHLEQGPEDFLTAQEAMERLETALSETARQQALASGAEGIQLNIARDVRTARVEAADVFVEAEVTVEASGRPRIAA